MKNNNPRIENVRDLACERDKELAEKSKIYVDTEGRPWRKDKLDKFHRVSVERKP